MSERKIPPSAFGRWFDSFLLCANCWRVASGTTSVDTEIGRVRLCYPCRIKCYDDYEEEGDRKFYAKAAKETTYKPYPKVPKGIVE
jgi:hypothetical protein